MSQCHMRVPIKIMIVASQKHKFFTKVHVHLSLTLHASYKYTAIGDYIYSIDYWDKMKPDNMLV